jgi:bifunctional DNA-binding transcriptional regulator/antitoxin component of YhaV-PrlF toxin-antitoxin module
LGISAVIVVGHLTTVASADGHILLPEAIRDALQWGPGTRLTIEYGPGILHLKEAPLFAPSTVDALFGSLRRAGPAVSVDDMNAAVAREAAYRAPG